MSTVVKIPWADADTSKPRLYFADEVVHYPTDQTAYAVWCNLSRGIRCAMRNSGDKTPVYSWDLVDQP